MKLADSLRPFCFYPALFCLSSTNVRCRLVSGFLVFKFKTDDVIPPAWPWLPITSHRKSRRLTLVLRSASCLPSEPHYGDFLLSSAMGPPLSFSDMLSSFLPPPGWHLYFSNNGLNATFLAEGFPGHSVNSFLLFVTTSCLFPSLHSLQFVVMDLHVLLVHFSSCATL